MKSAKNNLSEKKSVKEFTRKRRKSVREEIYNLWQEELEEKGFNKLNRLKQGLL